MAGCCRDFCLFLVMLLCPPLAVLIREGCNIHFCLNIFFTCLCWFPGLLHAIYVCYYKQPPPMPMHYAAAPSTVTTIQLNP